MSCNKWVWVVLVIVLSACESKKEQFLPSPIIDTVIVNEDKLTLHVRYFNLYDRSKNEIEIDGEKVPYEIDREKGNTFVVPVKESVFNDYIFARMITFSNSFGSTQKQIFSPEYPVIREIIPKRAYPGDTITIEGNNLHFKEDLSILFPTSNGNYIVGKIVYGDNYTLKIVVPEGAVSGALLYRNRLGKAEKFTGLLTDDFEIKIK
ncbi:MAG: IPT/TIG domain-containing protein [Sphingobacterium sp.]|jgi:hypothetical protein|nr:IPT/TIG domain-containing protein [Sphingobacterium sp.]